MRTLEYDEKTIRAVIKSKFGEDAVKYIDQEKPQETSNEPEEKSPGAHTEKPSTTPQGNQLSNKQMLIGCGTLFIIVVVIFALCTFPISGEDDSNGPTAEMAYFMSQVFVEKRLKAPSTADFPRYQENMVNKTVKDTYVVSSYVDAENSFGAQMRTHYVAELEYVGDDEWSAISVELLE